MHEQSEIVSNIIFRKIVQKVTKTEKKKLLKYSDSFFQCFRFHLTSVLEGKFGITKIDLILILVFRLKEKSRR